MYDQILERFKTTNICDQECYDCKPMLSKKSNGIFKCPFKQANGLDDLLYRLEEWGRLNPMPTYGMVFLKHFPFMDQQLLQNNDFFQTMLGETNASSTCFFDEEYGSLVSAKTGKPILLNDRSPIKVFQDFYSGVDTNERLSE